MKDWQRHTRTGDFRLVEQFQSRYLPTPRDILIYLPPGYYGHPRRRYPVLYLQDGQNLFDAVTSFIRGQEWQVDETADRLIRNGEIEPLIIVGIYNAREKRIDEYTPTIDAARGRGGQAQLYGEMLTREIKPCIDEQFRTRSGPGNTGLGGSSLGGILTLFLGMRFPHVFGKLAVMSPSLWWDDGLLVNRARKLPGKSPLRIWLDMGSEEGEQCLEDARELRDVLESKGWTEGVDLQHWVAQGAGHNERAWGARMGQVLKFLFPAGVR